MPDYFKNAGSKLKAVINAVFTVSIILHCIGVIILLIKSISDEAFLTFLIGILILAISLFFSWLALLTIATFADMAIDTADLATDLADIKFLLQHTKNKGDQSNQAPSIYCPNCGKGLPADSAHCPICGTKR